MVLLLEATEENGCTSVIHGERLRGCSRCSAYGLESPIAERSTFYPHGKRKSRQSYRSECKACKCRDDFDRRTRGAPPKPKPVPGPAPEPAPRPVELPFDYKASVLDSLVVARPPMPAIWQQSVITNGGGPLPDLPERMRAGEFDDREAYLAAFCADDEDENGRLPHEPGYKPPTFKPRKPKPAVTPQPSQTQSTEQVPQRYSKTSPEDAEIVARVKREFAAEGKIRSAQADGRLVAKRNIKHSTCCAPGCHEPRLPTHQYCSQCEDAGWSEDDLND